MQTDPFLTVKQTTAPHALLVLPPPFLNTSKVVTMNFGRVLGETTPPPLSKIAHHQPNSQQTNKSCRPSYCHLSSLCDSTCAPLWRSPADSRTWIKTWQIRPLIIEEGAVDGDRVGVSVDTFSFFPGPFTVALINNQQNAGQCMQFSFFSKARNLRGTPAAL